MKTVFTLLIIIITINQGHAQPNLRTKHFNLEQGVAIQGYDPVAYFTQKKAMAGNKKYEPQYGAWCAYAMGANNEKVEIDPETFKIINGKLYLFYHTWVNNTLTKWNEKETTLKANADKNWQKIYH